jgi:ATP-dependent RNA helicase DDX18/HAS1
LDLVKLARGFGFAAPPRVDIMLGAGMGKDKQQVGKGRREYGKQDGQGRRFGKR